MAKKSIDYILQITPLYDREKPLHGEGAKMLLDSIPYIGILEVYNDKSIKAVGDIKRYLSVPILHGTLDTKVSSNADAILGIDKSKCVCAVLENGKKLYYTQQHVEKIE